VDVRDEFSERGTHLFENVGTSVQLIAMCMISKELSVYRSHVPRRKMGWYRPAELVQSRSASVGIRQRQELPTPAHRGLLLGERLAASNVMHCGLILPAN
jgi:hypothetical protein